MSTPRTASSRGPTASKTRWAAAFFTSATTPGCGYSGESFNVYDAPRKVWHQTWVDSRGLLLLLEGGIHDGKMVLEGQTTGTDQTIVKHRITWTPNPDGSVRQLWESTQPNGAWAVAFDGKYTRK